MLIEPPSLPVRTKFRRHRASIFAEDSNYIYPVWIVTELPVGLRGLILAGIFAAAISSLDSILAALSQTTLSLFRIQKTNPENEKAKLLYSRILVFFWGIALSAFAIELNSLRGNVTNSQLGLRNDFLHNRPDARNVPCGSLHPQARTAGIAMGFVFPLFLWPISARILPDLINFNPFLRAASWGGLAEDNAKLKPIVHSAWAWPVTVFITWGCGLLFAKKAKT